MTEKDQTTGISESCGFMQRITNRVIGIIEKYGSTVMVISDKIGSYSPGSAERRYQKLLLKMNGNVALEQRNILEREQVGCLCLKN